MTHGLRAAVRWIGALVALVGALAWAPAAVASEPQITVDPSRDLGPISPLLYGANHRYAYDGFGMWDARADDAFPRFVGQVKDAGLSAVRYPGGTIANTFHWRRAIGPQAQRTPNVHGSTGEPLDNTFGPDEYGRFLGEVGATGDIVVNFATGDAQEAADWVEYMTTPVGENPNNGVAWADVRAANGHPAPYDIPYWEVGNEMANRNQRYWMAGDSDSSVGQLYALGGSTRFSRQPVGSATDWRDPASRSDGTGGQVFYVHYAPVAPGSQTVYVDGTEWRQTDDLQGAGAEDVYELDPATGRITFGDGTHGNVPPAGEQITISYTSGPHDGFADFYRAMKAVNPTIHVCSAIDNDDFLQAMGAEHPYDCVVDHPYVGRGAIDGSQPIDGYHDDFMRQPERLANGVRSLKESIARYAGPRAGDVSIVLTEYGHLASSNPDGYEHYHRSLDEALFDANALREWIALGVPLAERHALTDYVFAPAPGGSTAVGAPDNAIIAGPGPDTVSEPQAAVFSIFTRMMGDRHVAGDVLNDPQDDRSLPALTTVASTDDASHLYVVVVNQSAHDDVTARVRPVGYRHQGNAEVWTLDGPSYLSYNTPESPDTVRLTRHTVDLGEPGDFTYTFPAHSVTALRLTGTAAVARPELSLATDEDGAAAGTRTTATVTLRNPTAAQLSGHVGLTAPDGWTVNPEPVAFTLASGESTTQRFELAIPAGTPAGSYDVVAATTSGGVTTALTSSSLRVLDHAWTPLFADDFDDDPAGGPPPNWDVTPAGAGAVVADPGGGRLFRLTKDLATGAANYDAIALRQFAAPTGSIRFLATLRPAQTTSAIGVHLLDAQGAPVVRLTFNSAGTIRYTDAGTWTGSTPYRAGTEYRFEVVTHPDRGTYDFYVDGERVASPRLEPGAGAAAQVRLQMPNPDVGVSTVDADDVSVSVPR